MSLSCDLSPTRRRWRVSVLWPTGTLLCCLALVSPASAGTDKAESPSMGAPSAQTEGDAGLYVEVLPSKPLKVSALKPGEVIEGALSRDVYSEDRVIFPSGLAIRLTVGNPERRRKEPNDHWPGVVRLFSSKYENYPTFRAAAVTLPSGLQVPLQVHLISIGRRYEIHAPAKKSNAKPAAAAATPGGPPSGPGSDPAGSEPAHRERKSVVRGQTVILEAAAPTPEQTRELSALPPAPPPVTQPVVAAGTRGQIILLTSLSASKNHPGDLFRARLIEPVRAGSTIVLPEGCVLLGKVVKTSPPRWLSRPGSLQMAFTGLALPGGVAHPLTGSLSGVELDQRSRSRMNAEGGLSGDKPGKAWMLINLGVTAGIAKVTDDTTQLIIEAIVSTATDASTAGVAKIVAACTSGIFMVTRHGRDVVLPRFTRMEIAFDRPEPPLRFSPAAHEGKTAEVGQVQTFSF